MSTPHTTFTKNIRVIVIFKDGSRTIDRYVGKRKNGTIIFKKLGEVKLKLIRNIGIYKGE